jgi:hypothetical protein
VSTVAIVLQRQVFVDVAMEVMKNLPEPVPAIVPKVIPAMWSTFACYGVALAATIAIGWAWARFTRQSEPADVDAAPTAEPDPEAPIHDADDS